MRCGVIAHFNGGRSALEKYISFSGLLVKKKKKKAKSILDARRSCFGGLQTGQ